MSSGLPNSNIIEEKSEFLMSPFDPLDDSWSLLYQEISQLSAAPVAPPQIININNNSTNIEAVDLIEKQDLAAAIVLDSRLKSINISSPKSASKSTNKRKKNGADQNAAFVDQIIRDDEEEGPSSSSAAKKRDHNAKERIRRMKLNASFLALRALLPDSRRSKKRWSAPAIVDKVLKYIPELENEVEELKSKKLENLQLSEAASKNNKSNINIEDALTVSVTKVNEEEAIIQICMGKEDGLLAFVNLLQSLEVDEGIFVNSASTNYVCETRICYHLHIQINQSSSEAHHIEELRDKVISWLRHRSSCQKFFT